MSTNSKTEINQTVNENNNKITNINPNINIVKNTGNTIINPSLSNDNNGCTTEINQNINSDSIMKEGNESFIQKPKDFTEINPYAPRLALNLSAGTILLGKYLIENILNQGSGEANLYICSYRKKQYVAKIYRRSGAIKEKVIEALQTVNSPYVAKIYDTGLYEGSPFEIIPYYKYGSLEGRIFDYNTLENTIIPELNSGLHALHKKEIIHKDLKPANIMLCDNQKDIAIIDFGISSIREDGNTVVKTKTGMTPEYSASETFRNLFLEESDYYSLGITLYELFCGHTPYEGMDRDTIEQFVSVQKIPFPDNMPSRLKDLITGLTYNDITNRKDKHNPNRRWTYDEVKKWCNGESLALPGSDSVTAVDVPMQPYTFYRKKYYRIKDLAEAMALNWENGKKHLYRSTMSEFFKANNPDVANFCLDAEEEVSKDKNRADISFFKVLYQMAPDMKELIWKGSSFGTPEEYGKVIIDQAMKGYVTDLVDELFLYGVFSTYYSCVSPEKQSICNGIKAAEQKYLNAKENIEKFFAMTLVGRYLSKDNLFYNHNSIESFNDFILDIKYNNPTHLEEISNSLIYGNGVLNPYFESWLIILGKGRDVERWRNNLRG